MTTQLHERAAKAAAARVGQLRTLGMGHPTTCDIDYTERELEFMNAIQAWKNKTCRQFPTWREVLMILRSIGYER